MRGSRSRTIVGVSALALTLAACSSSVGPTLMNGRGMMGSAVQGTPTAPTGAPADSARVEPPTVTSVDGQLAVTLTAAEGQVPYGTGTRWAMTYNGLVTGPTLRVRAGDHVSITVVNHLNKHTSLHTHGLHVSPDQDNPFIMIEPGHSYTYTYDIPSTQQSGTYWYHPHVHEITAEQVASGLSGAIIVEDSTDATLATVSTDRVLVVNDPPLVESNPWTDNIGGSMMGGSMMTAMAGRTGPRILTNGADGVALTGSNGRLERVHIVNATASTRLRFSFDGAQMLRLSSTGGRLPSPATIDTVELSPGERTELVLVPGAAGATLTAQRISNEGIGGGVSLPEVIATVAPDAGRDISVLPTSMNADTRNLFAPTEKIVRQREITLDGHMNPTIDGVTFDPARVDFTATKGTVEEWVITSRSPMTHPIHLHTWPFQVQGEVGWNDVVTVPANGQRVIRVAFDDFAGTTVLHCHILDHEDTGMMAVIKVS